MLVTGLLLVGLVIQEDGLFAAAGHQVARRARHGLLLYVGAAVLISAVTAVLNLDTSVAFLTPVMVYAARGRGRADKPLLYGCVLLSNAGSLLLPGSNLTNLIVLGHLHLSGAGFVRRMAPADVASVAVTAAVVGVVYHRELRGGAGPEADRSSARPTVGVGALAVAAVVPLVIVLRNPALPVMAVGVAAVAVRLRPWRDHVRRVLDGLSVPVLIGLFGTAVALGTLGRSWSGPAGLLTRLGPGETAVAGAVTAVVVNNLPAASLLAARPAAHPFFLLVGLNVGPNLFVTGSLAWVLWRRAAMAAGARPSLGEAARVGLISAPLALAAAVVALSLTGAG